MVNFGNLDLNQIGDLGDFKAWELTHKDLVGKDLLIISAELNEFKTGSAYICKVFIIDDDLDLETPPIDVLLGGKATVNQITRYLDRLPFMAQVDVYKDDTYKRDSYRLIGASESAKIKLEVAQSTIDNQNELPF